MTEGAEGKAPKRPLFRSKRSTATQTVETVELAPGAAAAGEEGSASESAPAAGAAAPPLAAELGPAASPAPPRAAPAPAAADAAARAADSAEGWLAIEEPTASLGRPGLLLDVGESALKGLHALSDSMKDEGELSAFSTLLRGLLAATLFRDAAALRLRSDNDGMDVDLRREGAWQPMLRLPAWAERGLRDAISRAVEMSGGEPHPLGSEPTERFIAARAGDRALRFHLVAGDADSPAWATLRVLDPARDLSLERLGVPPDGLRRLRQWSVAREGLILVCGPADSGRSTTLRALARFLAGYRKTALIERVPGPEVPGIISFSSGVEGTGGGAAAAVERALDESARQLVLDDVEDAAAVTAALRAAMDEHLVVLGVRAGDAAEALSVLRNLGVLDEYLGEPLLGVLEQRLVRLLCPACRRRGPVDGALAEQLGLVPDSIPPEVAVAGPGCAACQRSGHRGRRPLFTRVELPAGLPAGCMSEELRRLVAMNRPHNASELGLALVVQGFTSLAELARVLAAGRPRTRPGGSRPAFPIPRAARGAAPDDATISVAGVMAATAAPVTVAAAAAAAAPGTDPSDGGEALHDGATVDAPLQRGDLGPSLRAAPLVVVDAEGWTAGSAEVTVDGPRAPFEAEEGEAEGRPAEAEVAQVDPADLDESQDGEEGGTQHGGGWERRVFDSVDEALEALGAELDGPDDDADSMESLEETESIRSVSGLPAQPLVPLSAGEAADDDRHVVLVVSPIPGDGPLALLRAALPEAEFRVARVDGVEHARLRVRGDPPTAMVLAGPGAAEPDVVKRLRDELSTAFLPLLALVPAGTSPLPLLRAGADEALRDDVSAEELELRVRAVIRRLT